MLRTRGLGFRCTTHGGVPFARCKCLYRTRVDCEYEHYLIFISVRDRGITFVVNYFIHSNTLIHSIFNIISFILYAQNYYCPIKCVCNSGRNLRRTVNDELIPYQFKRISLYRIFVHFSSANTRYISQITNSIQCMCLCI